MWLEASYVSPMRLVTSGVRAKTHLAQVRLGTQLATAYVKAFEAGQDRLLFNETAGSLMARRAAIGSPPGGLLWVPLAVLRALFPTAVFPHHNGNVPCFACAPVTQGYGLAAIGLVEATGGALDVIRKHLMSWPGFAACVAFDEWVANVDRHANNLLLAAGGRIVPIDHSDCFGGAQMQDLDFTGAVAWYANRLLEELFQPGELPLPMKAALVHAAERLPECHRQCAGEMAALRPWLDAPAGDNWERWVETRATLTAQWLRERVRMLV